MRPRCVNGPCGEHGRIGQRARLVDGPPQVKTKHPLPSERRRRDIGSQQHPCPHHRGGYHLAGCQPWHALGLDAEPARSNAPGVLASTQCRTGVDCDAPRVVARREQNLQRLWHGNPEHGRGRDAGRNSTGSCVVWRWRRARGRAHVASEQSQSEESGRQAGANEHPAASHTAPVEGRAADQERARRVSRASASSM